MVARFLDDIDRLLQRGADRAVERLAARHELVEPERLVASVVYAHFHLVPVRAPTGLI